MNRRLIRKLPYAAEMAGALDGRIREITARYIEERRRDADNTANPSRDIVMRCVDQLSRRTDARAQPQMHGLSVSLRDTRHALWNTKVLGSELARMNHIPADLHGGFDFCWSICSFEHLGSIERGLAFFTESMRCLKPGGVAGHTTEFNLDGTDETIENWVTVLFKRRHIEDLASRLASEGHRLYEVDYDPGDGVLDQFVDVPPFPAADGIQLRRPETPHLRTSVDGFPAMSIGLIARARA